MKKFLLLAAIAICTLSCNEPKKEPSTKIAVKTDDVKEVNDNCVKKFSFIAKPYLTADLSFRVDGQVKDFDTYAGSYFKKGDVIAAIDDRDYIIRQGRAEGVFRQAKSEYERIKSLYEKDNISASTFDKSSADFISAKTSFEIAQNELSDTRLAAPFNGYIGSVFIERHQDVRAAQPIVTLVDIDKIKIEAFVSQDIAVKANKIAYVNLRFDAIPDKIYKAKVADISKNTTDNNLSYLLTALLPNDDASLLPGMSGEVVFDTETSNSVTVIPQTAISHNPKDGDYVWCVDSTSGIVSKRIVKIGQLLSDGSIEVKENLKPGEKIAVSGLRLLSNGMTVTTL